MASTTGSKNTIGHLPIASISPTVQVSVAGGVAPRIIATPAPGPRVLTLGPGSVKIDLAMHAPENVLNIINNANIPGVTATLDRYGQLIINGASMVGGDALLLQHLGFA